MTDTSTSVRNTATHSAGSQHSHQEDPNEQDSRGQEMDAPRKIPMGGNHHQKPAYIAEVTSVPLSNESSNTSSDSMHTEKPSQSKQFMRKGKRSEEPRPWRTTWMRFGPLSGIFGVLLACASLVASLGILAGSDSRPISSWSVTPSTYIAIFTAIANLSIRYAAIQGVIIAWWCKAMKGSTVAKLHWDWRSGTTLRGALTAGRHMGLLGLACIFSTVVVIDGPLLQRATSVRSAPRTNVKPLNVTIVPQIPEGYTGGWYNATASALRWQLDFNATIPTPHGTTSNYIVPYGNLSLSVPTSQMWLDDAPIKGIVQGCPGICKAKIEGPALFPTACRSEIIPMVFNSTVYGSKTWDYLAAPFDQMGLVVSVTLALEGEYEVLNMITGFSQVHNCEGILNMSICTLESGTGEYDVSIQDDFVTIEAEAARSPRLITLSKNAVVSSQPGRSTLAGVVELAYAEWHATAVWVGSSPPLPPQLYADGLLAVAEYEEPPVPGQKCYGFLDPRADLMASLNKLMMYMGSYAVTHASPNDLMSRMDPGLSIHSTRIGEEQGHHNVFHTDYYYFLGAAVVELLCIALIAPTYWGWWDIGRPVSFSPIETAKAFQSPMFAQCSSNSSGRDIANAVGGEGVRYGVTHHDGRGSRLEFADPNSTSRPERGSRFEV